MILVTLVISREFLFVILTRWLQGMPNLFLQRSALLVVHALRSQPHWTEAERPVGGVGLPAADASA
jgi:hypothetical protein